MGALQDDTVVAFAEQEHARLLQRVRQTPAGQWIAIGDGDTQYLSRLRGADLRTLVNDMQYDGPLAYVSDVNNWRESGARAHQYRATLVLNVDAQYQFYETGRTVFSDGTLTPRHNLDLAVRPRAGTPRRVVPSKTLYLNPDAALEYLIKKTHSFASREASERLREVIIPSMYTKSDIVEDFCRAKARNPRAASSRLLGLWEV